MAIVYHFCPLPHFQKRLAERGISLEDCMAVVRTPDMRVRQYQGENGGVVFRLAKDINNKKLVVVAEIRKNDVWLITCFEP